jgi:hypothetical protein
MPSGFFPKKKPPFSALKGAQELENRSKLPAVEIWERYKRRAASTLSAQVLAILRLDDACGAGQGELG